MRHSLRALFVLGLNLTQSTLAQSPALVIGGLSSSPVDLSPSSMAWNPSVIGFLESSALDVHAGAVGGGLIFDRAGSDPNTGQPFSSADTTQVAPQIGVFFGSAFGTQNYRFGFGSYFPTGVTAEFDESGPQRYDLISGLLIPWHNQFIVAYRLSDTLSIAISGIVSVAFFKTSVGVDFSRALSQILETEVIKPESSSMGGTASVPLATATSLGGSLSLLWKPSYRWSVGLAFFSPVGYDFSGRLNLEVPSLLTTSLGHGLTALGIERQTEHPYRASSTMPMYLTGGVRFQPLGYWNSDVYFRYSFSSLNRSLSIRLVESSVEALRGLEISGKALDDSWEVGTVQSLNLLRSWTFGTTLIFHKHGIADDLVSLTQVDFDSFLTGLFVQKDWGRWMTGLEYSHTFLFERNARGTALASRASSSSLMSKPSTDGRYRATFDRISLQVRYAF